MSETPFDIMIRKWAELGLFKFLFPFMLSSAIFYGLLRKSKIFGERAEVVNATVALMSSFMIWSYPIIVGVDVTEQLAAFFMQGFLIVLVVSVGLMGAGMFHPNLQDLFKDKYPQVSLLFIVGLVVVGILLLNTSGLIDVFGGAPTFELPQNILELIMSIIAFTVLIGLMGAVVYFTGKEEGSKGGKEGK